MQSDVYLRQRALELKVPSSVAVLGVGGIGSWVALDLALVGVERLILVDPDLIEPHNLNRTPFKQQDIGKPKVQALAELIWERRPNVEAIPVQGKAEDFVELVKSAEVIIDCRDIFKPIGVPITAKLGYDGFRVTIHLNPREETVWGEEPVRYTTVPSFLVPPQLLASLITLYIVTERTEEEEVITFDVREVLGWLEGERRRGE